MRNAILCLAIFFAGLCAAADRPNVVLIFIDDMGYGDVQGFGAPMDGPGPRTPNLLRMAEEGIKFTSYYSGCAVCSGSRTSLLTGCHYQRLSMPAVLFPNSTQGLHPDEVTIADLLRDQGYATAAVGKWHLGHLHPCLPTDQGFDSYYGVPYSNDMWIDPANRLADDLLLGDGLTRAEVEAGHKKRNDSPLFRNDEVVEYPTDQALLTKKYTEEAQKFIRTSKEGPFFLYLPHTMVHLPLFASEKFAGRTERLIWDCIEEVDWSVGEILATLRAEGVAENTLVLFTSDNGAAVGSSLPFRARKGSVYDGGIRVPTIAWWPGKIPAGATSNEIVGSIDVLPTVAAITRAPLPERTIDGKDQSALLLGTEGAKGHEHYVLMHGPGCVRSGKWKYYPWGEKKAGKRDRPLGREPDRHPVQLYDTEADVAETTNLAKDHPELCDRLQMLYAEHLTEIQSNRRPTAEMMRPEGAKSSERPGKEEGKRQNDKDRADAARKAA